MSRINLPFAISFGFAICLILAVWTLAIREMIDIATERPSACFAMTASDCAALAERGW